MIRLRSLFRLWLAAFVLVGVCGGAAAATCTSGQAPYRAVLQTQIGTGDTPVEACEAALALQTSGTTFYGGSVTLNYAPGYARCDFRSANQSSTTTQPVQLVCEPAGSSSGSGTTTCTGDCTLTIVVTSVGGTGTATLSVSDDETRSMLIAACCVGIVALGFIGGNLS